MSFKKRKSFPVSGMKVGGRLLSGRFPTTSSCGTFNAGGEFCSVAYTQSGVYTMTFDSPVRQVEAVLCHLNAASGNDNQYEARYHCLTNETVSDMQSGVQFSVVDVDSTDPDPGLADISGGEISYLISITTSSRDA